MPTAETNSDSGKSSGYNVLGIPQKERPLPIPFLLRRLGMRGGRPSLEPTPRPGALYSSLSHFSVLPFSAAPSSSRAPSKPSFSWMYSCGFSNVDEQ
jgi:hypothetical protein